VVMVVWYEYHMHVMDTCLFLVCGLWPSFRKYRAEFSHIQYVWFCTGNVHSFHISRLEMSLEVCYYCCVLALCNLPIS